MDPAAAALTLEAPTDPKNKSRGPRKFASGERGFQTGTYPRRGPFTVYAKRPTKRGDTDRDGRTFYVLDELRDDRGRLALTPPGEGWAFYLARVYGPGTYRVHHVGEDGNPARAILYISPEIVARAGGQDPDDDDDDAPEAAQPNPPIVSDLERTIAQIEALKRAQEVLQPAPAPSLLDTLAGNPGLMQVLAQALRPPTPPPAPKPPPAPSTDPWSIVAKHAADAGITPEQAIRILADRLAEDAAQP